MRLLFKFLLLPLLSVLLIGFVSSNVVSLIDLSDRSMYSSKQTLYQKIV